MSEHARRSVALIQKLLEDRALRDRFRRDPARVCLEEGLPDLADELSGAPRAAVTLELRESRSSLAGVMLAAAAEGVQAAHIAARVGTGLEGDLREAVHRALEATHHHAARHPHAAGAGFAGGITATAPQGTGQGSGTTTVGPDGAVTGGPSSGAGSGTTTVGGSGVPAGGSAQGSGTTSIGPGETGGAAPGSGVPSSGEGANTGAGTGHPGEGSGTMVIEPDGRVIYRSGGGGAGGDGTVGHAGGGGGAGGDGAVGHAGGRHPEAAGVRAEAGLAHDGTPADLYAYPGDGASPQQIATWMAAHAVRAGLPAELPVMASLTESGLRNLPYGDRDSLGFFQMRAGLWDNGPYAGFPKRPDLQLRWFIEHALQARAQHGGDPGYGRDPGGWGEWVADVEQPAAAYRGRYQDQLAAAQELLRGVDLTGVRRQLSTSLEQRALDVAMRFVGDPYHYGGASPATGFDCSGLVQYAYGQVGVQLPRVAADQFLAGTPVPRAQLRPGDVVFFADSTGYVHHEGVYVGDGRFLHAPSTGEDVHISSLSEPYFATQYAGARRFVDIADPRSYARTLPTVKG